MYFRPAIEDGVLLAVLARLPACPPARLGSRFRMDRWTRVRKVKHRFEKEPKVGHRQTRPVKWQCRSSRDRRERESTRALGAARSRFRSRSIIYLVARRDFSTLMSESLLIVSRKSGPRPIWRTDRHWARTSKSRDMYERTKCCLWKIPLLWAMKPSANEKMTATTNEYLHQNRPYNYTTELYNCAYNEMNTAWWLQQTSRDSIVVPD